VLIALNVKLLVVAVTDGVVTDVNAPVLGVTSPIGVGLDKNSAMPSSVRDNVLFFKLCMIKSFLSLGITSPALIS
jgi:hypothetical protein